MLNARCKCSQAVPNAGTFKDTPDVISALVKTSSSPSPCAFVSLSNEVEQSVTSGNINAKLGTDGTVHHT